MLADPMFIDASDPNLGYTFGGFAVDGEMSWNNNKGISSTTADTFGYLLNLLETVNGTWSFGARAEYVKDGVIAGQSSHETYLVFAGPQVNLTEALKLKIDYMGDRRHAGADGWTTTHGGQIAAVHRF